MNSERYAVIPEWGNPLGYFLLQREKGLRWYVSKVFQDARKSAYHYQFMHLNAQGKVISEAAYPGFALENNISRADNERAARWFLTCYFSFRELHYYFVSVADSGLSGYYPVLGRPLMKKADFELSWE